VKSYKQSSASGLSELRHACGYKLANDGHDTRAIPAYLGHRNIQNTTRYTALAPERFLEFFRD
jgi:type 1 fimbriae regulatory protein FimB/type 1 fimbriae regulatory protein FimE